MSKHNKTTTILTAVLAAFALSMTAANAKAAELNAAAKAQLDAIISSIAGSGGELSAEMKAQYQAMMESVANSVKVERPKASGDAKLDGITGNLCSARENLNQSKVFVLAAIKAKDDSKAAVAAAVDTAGADKGELSATAKKAYDDGLAAAVELTAEGKKIFALGAAQYGVGLAQMVPQLSVVNAYVDETNAAMKKANPMAKAKMAKALKPASALASSLPGDIKEALAAGGRIIQYGVKNGVDMSNLQKTVDKYTKEAQGAQ